MEHWPQYTYLAIIMLGLGCSVAQHGQPRPPTNALARELFSGGPNADDLTAAEAAAVVRHMLATGEVVWS